MADQLAAAVEQHDLDLDAAARHHIHRGPLRGARDLIAQRDAFRRRVAERFRGGVRRR